MKDVLETEGLKVTSILFDLLTLLAFQIGKEVSLSELGASLGLRRETVRRYLDLLEKVFAILKIKGFSRNLRKEVTKSARYYFWDNGVRNAIINNFNGLHLRDDVGMLWENYLVTERLKRQEYKPILSNNYFWRTYDQKELDWVEERDGVLHGYEFKWNEKKSSTAGREFQKTYENSTVETITRENFLKFIL